MNKLPLVITDLAATTLMVAAGFLILKLVVFTTPLSKIQGLHTVVASL